MKIILVCSLLLSSFLVINAQKPQGGNYLNDVLKGSVFIYAPGIPACSIPPQIDDRLIPLGSGFIVGLKVKGSQQSDGRSRMVKFLVTCQHVVGNLDSI